MNTDETMNPDEAARSAPGTPEQVMQAATARIAELEAELAEMKDRWMRAEAEIANVRARARREVDETRQYAVQKFAQRRGRGGREPAAAASTACRRRPTASRRSSPRVREGLDGIERNFLGHPGAQRHQARGPDRRAVRSQPAPGDGRAGERGARARHA